MKRLLAILLLLSSSSVAQWQIGQRGFKPSATSSETTVFSDNFNRANGALGTNWTAAMSVVPTVSSNVATATYNLSLTVYASGSYVSTTAGTFTANQGSQVDILQLDAGSAPCTRLQSGNSDNANGKGYCFFTGEGTAYIDRINGNSADVQCSGTVPFSMGTLKLISVGSTHTGYINGTQVLTCTDTTYATGYPGFRVGNVCTACDGSDDTPSSVDNFVGYNE